MQEEDLVILTADIVSAHVTNNHVAVGDLGTLICSVHGALTVLTQPPPAPEPERRKGFVSARASLKPDFLICMSCGARLLTLKRHIAVAHDMTPDQYRAEFGLAASYPMTAPNYSESRRAIAKSLGLGRKTGRRKTGGARTGSASPGRSAGRPKGRNSP